MDIKVKNKQDSYIISICGDVDASSSITLDEAMETAIKQTPTSILVDGKELSYISSAGLGVFMSYLEELREKNIFFAIYGLSEKVENVFEILGLNDLMSIVADEEEAKRLQK